MEWILNYAKNGSNNTSMLRAMVAGAEEYYQYTKALTENEGEEAAKALKSDNPEFQKVGIEAPDATHLTSSPAPILTPSAPPPPSTLFPRLRSTRRAWTTWWV